MRTRVVDLNNLTVEGIQRLIDDAYYDGYAEGYTRGYDNGYAQSVNGKNYWNPELTFTNPTDITC